MPSFFRSLRLCADALFSLLVRVLVGGLPRALHIKRLDRKIRLAAAYRILKPGSMLFIGRAVIQTRQPVNVGPRANKLNLFAQLFLERKNPFIHHINLVCVPRRLHLLPSPPAWRHRACG